MKQFVVVVLLLFGFVFLACLMGIFLKGKFSYNHKEWVNVTLKINFTRLVILYPPRFHKEAHES